MDHELTPASTCRVLVAAGKHLDKAPEVFMDSCSENVNGDVDHVFDVEPLRRVLAQVDVSYSNSLIEA